MKWEGLTQKYGKVWPQKREGLTPKKGRTDSLPQKMRRTDSKNEKKWLEKFEVLSRKTRRSESKHRRKESKYKRCVETRTSPFLFIHIINTFLKEVYFDQDLWLNLKKHLIFVLQEFLLKVDYFLLIPFSFLHIFIMFWVHKLPYNWCFLLPERFSTER